MRLVAIFFGLSAVFMGCGTIRSVALREIPVSATNSVPFYIPNPILTQPINDIGGNMGPYGAAASAIVLGALSAWSAYQNKKRLQEHIKSDEEKVKT